VLPKFGGYLEPSIPLATGDGTPNRKFLELSIRKLHH
jgi:hypothetical protein